MDIDDLLNLLRGWIESHPVVRGYGVEDAELRLRGYGAGTIAVWLRPNDPMAELRAVGRYLIDKLDEVRARDVGENVEPPTIPDFPDKAFADFADLDELERILRGQEPGRFSFKDEISQSGDPLCDP